MMKLPSAAEMQALDHSASEHYGIPSIVLMENAGLGTVRMMTDTLGPCDSTFALIFIGPGNNGGDGLVIGRHLHQRGCHPVFFFLINPDKLKGDSAVNLHIVRKLNLPLYNVDTSAKVETIPAVYSQLEARGLRCYAIVDSIFGIGLSRNIDGHYADIINLINKPAFRRSSTVVAVDIPSGMDSNSGKILGTCVLADFTATYACPKPGHFIHGSKCLVGKLDIIDIGIPPEAVSRANIAAELVTQQTFKNLSGKLHRKQNSHKGDHGHLLVLAGSTGKTGAAILAAKGALRSGAGLITLAVPWNLNVIFETSLAEAMTVPLPSSNGHLSIADADLIMDNIASKQAVVIGPGIGQSPDTEELVLEIYHNVSCPVIFDADALNLLSKNKSRLQPPAGDRIFTPHPGELSRLIDKSCSTIQDNRLDAAVLGCSLFKNIGYDTVLLLKGAGTIVAESNGSVFFNSTGNPGMATGGMGDVLSGVIGGLVCQGLGPLEATVAGAYLHGAAADLLYSDRGPGFTATEVADNIPQALMKNRNSLS